MLPAHLNVDDIRVRLEALHDKDAAGDEWVVAARNSLQQWTLALLQSAPVAMDVGEVITILRKVQALADRVESGHNVKSSIQKRKRTKE